MKAALTTQVRTPLTIGELPDPSPGPGEAVVRVEASGICRSDWHLWNGDWSWLGITPQLPLVQGHEIGGVVAAVGPDVQTLKEGDRVTVPFHLACGHCAYCSSGRSHLCLAYGVIGVHSNGGFAQAARVPNADATVVRLPDAVDYVSAAALGCRYMTAYHGLVDRAQVRPGEWVAVFAMGGLGLSTVQIAAALGARVLAISRSEEKLVVAKREGAETTLDARTEHLSDVLKELTGGGADVTVDALGSAGTTLPAVLSLRKGGRHLQLGLTSQDEQGLLSLPVDAMVLQELSFIPSLGCPMTSYPDLLDRVASGQLNPQRLVGRTIALGEINSVLAGMSEYATHGLNVITSWS